MVVSFRFCDPGNETEMRDLARRLRRERRYFQDMQINPPPVQPMTAEKFVRFIRPWPAERAQAYGRLLAHHIGPAIDDVMTKVLASKRRVSVDGTITFALLDRSVEKGFPFTLLNVVFLPDGFWSESAETQKRTALHECVHIMQRYQPAAFDAYYKRAGFVQLPCSVVDLVRRTGNGGGLKTISNPDTFRARVYGVPLDDKGRVLVTNLAIDPKDGDYRELAFVLNASRRQVLKWGWLAQSMKALRAWPGLPSKSRDLLDFISQQRMEGHPHESFARLLETFFRPGSQRAP